MTKFNKNTSNRSKAYSPEEVGKIMEIMRANSFNISKTNKETKISRATLTKFRDKYRTSLAINDRVKHDEIQATEECSEIRDAGLVEEGDYIQNLYTAKKQVLNRIIKLIPTELNLDRLTKTFLALETINSNPTEKEDPKYIWENLSKNLIKLQKQREEEFGEYA
ncbi:hypothetical protein [Ancylomarina euxinus]|nr:hypothetical protein [Ancylomarina euxinus]MCZ4694640.1 hypothetical protein [Ancylomarina euxinus]MUP14183.1 hypothetical protein [Ancylomarina euxinus]